MSYLEGLVEMFSVEINYMTSLLCSVDTFQANMFEFIVYVFLFFITGVTVTNRISILYFLYDLGLIVKYEAFVAVL